ncbi:MAG: DUF1178 family protein [Parvibaculaceae bacterium]|nr:DUF1178 family protein [Parvibaculaceae bacterium]
MIRYQLLCKEDHEFDGWFTGSAEFDRQVAQKEILCPVCGSSDVRKGLMAPSVATSRMKAQGRQEKARQVAMETVGDAMRALKREVERECDDVGTGFAEEARKIHYGEAEERGIYGDATVAEAKELLEEGVDILPLPFSSNSKLN